jgi:hypothetical protein
MKWASFIFTFIILTQAFWPCSDSLLPNIAIHAEHAQKESKKEAGSDLCGPLCTCSCCATPSIIQLATHFAIKLQILSPVYFEYTPAEYRGVSMSIWQPPRMTA